ncbi:PREDICTED: growth arrest-specific protein 1-like [Priapulus caudatus]|uniref:Growth arrest-specific protein 1-like n=1 Tax=Priapulus caudatus TaxID=37621 RepID=A0ABM1DQZ8_PRICU|nr:PREDICTED: growth arrest-specific protein 1-like [Priapulus caudatus]
MTSRNCSTPCRRAFLTFAVTDMGYEYLERCACDAADWRCKNTKTAHRLCKDVDVRTGNGVDCDVAEERCRHDVTCNLGLTYFRSHCGDMLEGEQCTELCNRTISVLYWSQTGADFLFCACSERSARTECDMRRMFMHELCDFPHESRRRSDRDAATPTSASPWVVAIAAAAACVVASLARVELPPTP